VGAVAGLTVSLVSSEAARLAVQLERLEHPAVIVILVFAGAMWSPPELRMWALPVVYLLVRRLAVQGSAWLAPRVVGDAPKAHRMGLALLPQGGIAIAVATSFAQAYPEQAPMVLTVALVGVLASDLAGVGSVRRVLADAGEIVPEARFEPQASTEAAVAVEEEG
jgi:hypothetical protein